MHAKVVVYSLLAFAREIRDLNLRLSGTAVYCKCL
jgi:hypothetical protein